MSAAVLLGLLRYGTFTVTRHAVNSTTVVNAHVRRAQAVVHPSALSRVGSASVLGLRKQNEDRLRVSRIRDNLLYFSVFDGHGGPHAADYCYTFMEKFIRDALEDEEDLEKVLKKAFVEADKALHTHLSYFNNASFLTAGTTATVAMLRDGVELVVGGVGDSRALLCRKGHANKLSRDHTPDCKEERRRIQKFGGFVTWNSVGEAYVNGRLAMTRSIGDFHLKSSGVIEEPDTRRINVQHADDNFLALTTDGINFLLSDQEICDVISQCQDPTEAAEVITQQALQYGSEDNATIIVVPFGAWGRSQSSNATYSMSRNFTSGGRWAQMLRKRPHPPFPLDVRPLSVSHQSEMRNCCANLRVILRSRELSWKQREAQTVDCVLGAEGKPLVLSCRSSTFVEIIEIQPGVSVQTSPL